MKLDDPKVVDLLGDSLASTLTSVFGQIEIAEQEIVAARGGKTEPDDDDPLWRAFMLLRATDDLMVTEYVYRAHVREILARVAAGQPTAPATDTELVCAISRASQVAPAHREAVGLQTRLFARLFPDKSAEVGIDVDGYERLYGPEMDQLEQTLRREGSQDWRQG